MKGRTAIDIASRLKLAIFMPTKRLAPKGGVRNPIYAETTKSTPN